MRYRYVTVAADGAVEVEVVVRTAVPSGAGAGGGVTPQGPAGGSLPDAGGGVWLLAPLLVGLGAMTARARLRARRG